MNQVTAGASGQKPKKRKGRVWIVLGIIVVVIAGGILALQLIFPGLLWKKSLGVTYDGAIHSAALDKLGMSQAPAPTAGTRGDYNTVYGDPVPVDTTLDSAELTAFFAENRPDYYAIQDPQIRIGDDDTIELVASADVSYFLDVVMGGTYTLEEIKAEMPALGLLPDHVNIALTMDAGVSDNKADVDLKQVSVQGIPIPSDIIDSGNAQQLVEQAFDSILQQYSDKAGLFIDELSVHDGTVDLKGLFPSSVDYIPKS